MKKIYFVTANDLTYDQRMIRICRSMASYGYAVVLLGVKQQHSIPLIKESFDQRRLRSIFSKGKLFYFELNIRLFFFLLFTKTDLICAVDLDTIMPCLVISHLKGTKRVYDAHELFSEMKEVISRPMIKKAWRMIEKISVPKFKNGYTVSKSIAEEFLSRYGVKYEVIRNLPLLLKKNVDDKKANVITGVNMVTVQGMPSWINTDRFILYQGAVNHARGLENLIAAMRKISAKLLICGDGNLMSYCQNLSEQYKLHDKIFFMGRVEPGSLYEITCRAYIGINLVEPYGLNQYYSLANKFFDYMHAEVPQLTMDFPEYRKINDEYRIAVLIDETTEKKIVSALNNLLQDNVLYQTLQENCRRARLKYNWEEEQKKLLGFYQKILS